MNKVPPDVRLTIVADSCHSGGLIDHTKEQIGDSFQSSGEGYGNEEDGGANREWSYGRDDVEIQNKSLPLDTSLDVSKQKSGKDNVGVRNMRTTLLDIFGDDVSSTVKKFARSLMGQDTDEQGGGGFMGLVGSLVTQFVN